MPKSQMPEYRFPIKSSAVGAGFSTLQSHIEKISETADASRTQGVVATHYGFVDVEQWVYSTGSYDDSVLFQIVLEGRLFTGLLHKAHSKRYLVTLAHRFAEQAARVAQSNSPSEKEEN